MKHRYIHWGNLLFVIFSIFMLSLPLAIGYIPIYHWFGLNPPTNLGIYWAYGFLYCLIAVMAIFVVLFVGASFTSIKRLYNFIFPCVASSKEETDK